MLQQILNQLRNGTLGRPSLFTQNLGGLGIIFSHAQFNNLIIQVAVNRDVFFKLVYKLPRLSICLGCQLLNFFEIIAISFTEFGNSLIVFLFFCDIIINNNISGIDSDIT